MSQYFSVKPNNLSFGLGKGYWALGKGKFKPFSPKPEKYWNMSNSIKKFNLVLKPLPQLHSARVKRRAIHVQQL
ncbi:hypothetical protein [Nostoc punctiforme]|uniref:hypothetical protein n=1 Tax=Nostoc punctiforme TaxID=272131 RepID=UPI0002D61BAD|nr:hypothetical protein [Nostoc punctiforme]